MKPYLLFTLLVALTGSCLAQAPATPVSDAYNAEFFVGYTYMHSDYSGSIANSNGFTAAFTYLPTDRFGITMQGSGLYGGEGFRNYGFGVGPRINLGKRNLQPYLQALIGYSHSQVVAAGSVESKGSYATDIGGGLDLARNGHHLGWRVVQVEWERQYHGLGSTHGSDRIRLSTGLSFNF